MSSPAKWLTSCAVFGMLAVMGMPTALSAEVPIVVVVKFFPADGREDEAQARLAKLATFVSANNPGVTFTLHRSVKQPVVFLMHETFPTQAALDSQPKTILPAFVKEFGPTPEGLFTKPNEIELYRPASN